NLNATAEANYVIKEEGTIKFCNKSCHKMLGYQNENELIGKNSHLLFHHHNSFNQIIPVEDCEVYHIFKTGKGVYSDKEVFWKKDHTNINVEYFAYPIYFQDHIEEAVVTFFDITNRKNIERQLKESVRSHSVLLANLPGMAYKCNFDREWTMQFVSEGCYELTGHRPEALINNRDLSFNDLIAPEYQDHLWQVWVAAVKNRTSIREEYIIITATGQRKWVLEQGQPIYNETGVVESLEGLILDISEQKIKQLEIQYLSQHDVLTGLFNRAFFDKERSRLDYPQFLPLSIIIGDINGLKLTNDAFGHDEGDRLIQKTANIIKSAVREDDFVARTGGDEFTILLPNTDSETAYYYLKKIQALCEKDKSDLLNKGSIISLSLGFATKESMTQNINSIQKIAEDFMYKRKLLERSSLHSSFISSITATMFEKSQETEAHAERMRILSVKVGKKLGLHQKDLDELALLATLHDIGKVSIDRNILNKPGKLTEEEWNEIKKHPEIGYRITKASPELSSIAEYVLSHHERWDGSGYPQGLKEQNIPLLSRIISIVDAYDAMTNARTYRQTKSPQDALLEIKEYAGRQFDPHLAFLFIELMEEDMKR
ncbi:MAG: HD domain-containing phosphohydrolase, partial [Bacilli bacterium]